MSIVVPEKCWASNKICNKNLCCIWLAFYFHILTTMNVQNHIKYVTGGLLVWNLWTKNIVDSVSTTLCSFLQSDLMCYVCTNWNMFTRQENTENFIFVVSSNSSCLVEKFCKLQIILKIQTWVTPSYQFVNFSVFPDLNLIILLTSKPNKFPRTSCTIKIHFAL
jgi:ABC-type polysaccharide/polyol phosphate export permease